jgi:hypothetical protein
MMSDDDTAVNGLPLDPVKRRAGVDAQFDDFKQQLAALDPSSHALPAGLATSLIYGVRAKSQGEVTAHCITRAAFLRCIVADARTRALFAQWRHESKLDLVVAEWSAQLDAAAAQADLPDRSALHHDAAAYDALPASTRLFFAQLEDLRAQRTEKTRAARAPAALLFVDTVLFKSPPPIRAWLATDLLRLFDADILRDIWGEAAVQLDINAGTRDRVKPGQRPMHEGEHLERDALWYYQTTVQSPRVTLKALAQEYQAARAAGGLTPQPKDRDGRDRANDSIVRRGVANAKRLLELSIPPEQWSDFTNQA